MCFEVKVHNSKLKNDIVKKFSMQIYHNQVGLLGCPETPSRVLLHWNELFFKLKPPCFDHKEFSTNIFSKPIKRMFLGGRGSFIDTSNWEEEVCIHNFKNVWAPIILAEKILSYFSSSLRCGLKKCLLLYSFFIMRRLNLLKVEIISYICEYETFWPNHLWGLFLTNKVKDYRNLKTVCFKIFE